MTDEKPKTRRWRIRTVLYLFLLLVIAGGLAWLFGPREPVDLTVRFDPAVIGDDIDAYLAANEAKIADMRPDSDKQIVWAYPASHAKTPFALVDLHGFSAARQEIRPVPDMVAADLGANLFFTRLKGHGRTGDAMTEATVNDWIQDAAEAVAIGERIGEKVVIVGVSTGATLGVLAATLPEMKDRVAGIVLISPNFRINAATAPILTFPFARTIVPLVAGGQRSFEPHNEAHARNWTWSYPTVALLPMAAMVKRTASLPFEDIGIPALFIYHPDDSVVDESVAAEVAGRWGGPVTTRVLTKTGDPSNHVVAGDIISPETNAQVAGAIAEFVRGL
ncbi:MAG: alpha/beta fold hydrolase [Oricola sp.]